MLSGPEAEAIDLLRRLGSLRSFVRVFRSVVSAGRSASDAELRAAWQLLEEVLAIDLDGSAPVQQTRYRVRGNGVREHALQLASSGELTASALQTITKCAYQSSRQFIYGLRKEGLIVKVAHGRYRLASQDGVDVPEQMEGL